MKINCQRNNIFPIESHSEEEIEEEVPEKGNDMFLEHGSFISLDDHDFHFKALDHHF